MTTLPSFSKTAALGILCLGLVACSNSSERNRLQGERIDAFATSSDYSPSEKLSSTTIEIPTATTIKSWPIAGQNPYHNVGNMEFNGSMKTIWTSSISSAGAKRRLVAPVSDGNNVYFIDEDHVVIAKDIKTGKTIWEFEPEIPEGDEDSFGGGLSVHNGRLIVGTPFGKLYALDANIGTLLWEQDKFLPLSGGATISNDNVGYITNIDNTLIAFNTGTGERLWRHVGFRETSALVGGASPAYINGLLLMGYSNGEMYAIRANDGLNRMVRRFQKHLKQRRVKHHSTYSWFGCY